MSDFQGIEDLLRDFLFEAGDLLAGIDRMILGMGKRPADRKILNDIFRGFRTIKDGGALLGATELVALCHLTESLFDRLRNGELVVAPATMGAMTAAMATVHEMFALLENHVQPRPASPELIDRLKAAMKGGLGASAAVPTRADHSSLAATFDGGVSAGISIPVERARLDQVLNLSGEIGLAKTRLTGLRSDILAGKRDADTLREFDVVTSRLDSLVRDLQTAAIRTRLQPIGCLFQKLAEVARDFARRLGKDVELVISGEQTEIDETMMEGLADPVIRLLRNAVDHGVESPPERSATGKPTKSRVRLDARLEGGHVVITVSDDGRGMKPEMLSAMACEKGLVTDMEVIGMDGLLSPDRIFQPGVSTANKLPDLSGYGGGMSVVKAHVQKLNGTIDLRSAPGEGTSVAISLPLTLAILKVLLVRHSDRTLALPLSLVREIVAIREDQVQEVGERAAMMVRGEIYSVLPLSSVLGSVQHQAPAYGVMMQIEETSFILGIDGFSGCEDSVINPLSNFRSKGIAGVIARPDGQLVPVLDVKELLSAFGGARGVPRGAVVCRELAAAA